MITLAFSACTSSKNNFNPFDPYPLGIETKFVDKTTEKTIIHDFKRTSETDNSKVKQILEKYPPLTEMKKWVEKGTFKEEMFKIHPLAYPLLRWLVASNRCHLKKLTKNEQITEMNTEHQYLLLSGTPEKEKKFQDLKKKTWRSFRISW